MLLLADELQFQILSMQSYTQREYHSLPMKLLTSPHSSTQIKALCLDAPSTCQIPSREERSWEEMTNEKEQKRVATVAETT